jgi:hypothetical protein
MSENEGGRLGGRPRRFDGQGSLAILARHLQIFVLGLVS